MPVSPVATTLTRNSVRTWSSLGEQAVGVGDEDAPAAVAVAGRHLARWRRPAPRAASSARVQQLDLAWPWRRRPGRISTALTRRARLAGEGHRRGRRRRPRGPRPPPPRPRPSRPASVRSAVWAKPVVSPDHDPDAGAAVAPGRDLLDLAVVEARPTTSACPRRRPRRSRRRCAGAAPSTRSTTSWSIRSVSALASVVWSAMPPSLPRPPRPPPSGALGSAPTTHPVAKPDPSVHGRRDRTQYGEIGHERRCRADERARRGCGGRGSAGAPAAPGPAEGRRIELGRGRRSEAPCPVRPAPPSAPQRRPRHCRAKRVGASRSAAADGDEATAVGRTR